MRDFSRSNVFDGNYLRRVGSDGVVRLAVRIAGKLVEPKIWNSIDAPRIWSITFDKRKRIYTALPNIGQVVRIAPTARNRSLTGAAERGKTSVNWFYGFKLHLIINDCGELLRIHLTKGNVDDRTPVTQKIKDLWGTLYGDRGYLSEELSRF